ncbi:spermidine synthase [Legionella gresilensis]|uniref:spermidine synthase n=1 Tax=Legionella gresilensis TaxID=91823 RepID=UPI001F5E7251|nr:fused MFS/spermidine synthase [Legionella gresilensis]
MFDLRIKTDFTLIQLLFSLSLFLSAFLLFLIQPMVAKNLLPIYGGTPAVWTVCMLFFQAILLLGYGYAWVLSYFGSRWYWRLIYLTTSLISFLYLPLNLTPETSKLANSPDLFILKELFLKLGLPLLTIASASPLLQYVFSCTKIKRATDPYFLYVASNFGSLAALVSYPGFIEWWIGLDIQYKFWRIGFTIYLVSLTVILLIVPFSHISKTSVKQNFISLTQLTSWIGYSFVPCSLMLGVTFYISTDIAATPLFWVVPLALYLVSFIITFAQKPIISHQWITSNILIFAVFPILAFIIGPSNLFSFQSITIHLIGFFVIALLCHGELIRRRPIASELTSFYLCIALGGVLAGLFNGVLAPRIFNGPYEYPLVFALSFLCLPMPMRGLNRVPIIIIGLLIGSYLLSNVAWLSWLRKYYVAEIFSLFIIFTWTRSRLSLCLSILILFIFIFSPWFKHLPILTQQRNFYGIKQVVKTPHGHALISQSTIHGLQLFDLPTGSLGATSYYGPPASIIHLLQQQYPSLRTMIIGLGTGTMVCQFRPSDIIEVVDIDEQVINIASNPYFFTYLQNCSAKPLLTQGDGRLVLRQRAKASLDLLVIDAFSSDAIPTHLLTYEAFQLYKHILSNYGLLLVHISNRHLNLLPILTAIGQKLDWTVLNKNDVGDPKKGQLASEWVLLTSNKQFVGTVLQKHDGWKLVTNQKAMLWTDNYSNIIHLLKQ